MTTGAEAPLIRALVESVFGDEAAFGVVGEEPLGHALLAVSVAGDGKENEPFDGRDLGGRAVGVVELEPGDVVAD